MRHVHPIRQSGPIPAYHGDYTMEDVRKHMWYIRAPYDSYHESTDVEELMRRVNIFSINFFFNLKKIIIKIFYLKIFRSQV